MDTTIASFVLINAKPVGADWSMSAHAHSDIWEMILLARGGLTIGTGNREIVAGPGSVLVYPPRCVHAERSTAAEGAAMYCIWWRMQTAGPSQDALVYSDPAGHLRHAAGWLQEVWSSMAPDRMEVCQQILAAMLWQLQHPQPLREDPGIAAAKAYVQSHLPREISVAQMAAAAGLSPDHFAHAFRRATGVSPIRFVRTLRMDTASRLLLTTPMSVKEVAAAVGFASTFEFSRAFKRATATSPTAYRSAAGSSRPARA